MRKLTPIKVTISLLARGIRMPAVAPVQLQPDLSLSKFIPDRSRSVRTEKSEKRREIAILVKRKARVH